MHSLFLSTLNRACVAVPISEQKEHSKCGFCILGAHAPGASALHCSMCPENAPLHLLRENSRSMCSVFCALGKQLLHVLQLSSSISSLSCEEKCSMFSSVLSICSASQLLPVLLQSCSMSLEKAAAPVPCSIYSKEAAAARAPGELIHVLHQSCSAPCAPAKQLLRVLSVRLELGESSSSKCSAPCAPEDQLLCSMGIEKPADLCGERGGGSLRSTLTLTCRGSLSYFSTGNLGRLSQPLKVENNKLKWKN